ncbi:MAG: hypothetical protein ANABAC_0076 [Anaerolineae bacterium]|nr:MAG: hypothetical protein ANABAC_0076 [Anaerolineae bacterium]
MYSRKNFLFTILIFVLLGGMIIPAPLFQVVRAAMDNAPAADNSVSVVVQFSTTDRLIRKVSFSSSTITGLDALLNSGLEVVTADTPWGKAVCSIEGVGCPADDCFCGGSTFWNYEFWDGTAWQGHSSGASSTTLTDGAVDGWRWGEWGGQSILPYPQLERAWKALQWLKNQQNSDGGYGSPSSAASSSVESLLAIGANHHKASEWRQNISTASILGYMMANGSNFTKNSASGAGKFAVGASSTQLCFPFQARSPADYYDPATGKYHPDAGPQAWAILGTLALSQTVPADAVTYLKNLSLPTGGWEWSDGWTADTNTTALAIQALVGAGVDPGDPVIVSGLNFIKSAQNNDGGFTYDPDSTWGTASDANSTAYVLQAIYAVGQDPTSAAWQEGGKTAIDFLATVQLADGSLEWQPSLGSNLLATQQAIPALLGRPAPFAIRAVEACKVSFLPTISR